MGGLLPTAHAQRDGIQRITLVRRNRIRRRAAVVHTRAGGRYGTILCLADSDRMIVVSGQLRGSSRDLDRCINIIHTQNNILAALLQLVVYSIHTNLVLVRIHRTAGAVHGKRDTAEAVVCLGRNGKAHIRTLGNRAAAIPVNVHARAFRGGNRDVLFVQLGDKVRLHIGLHIGKAQRHAAAVPVYAVHLAAQPDTALRYISRSGLHSIVQPYLGDLIAASGVCNNVCIVPAPHLDTASVHVHALIAADADGERLFARLTVAEKVDAKAFFCGQRHRNLAVRHGKRIGFIPDLDSTIGQIGRVRLSRIRACHLYSGDLGFSRWRGGDRNRLVDAVCPPAADLDAAVCAYIRVAGDRFHGC